MILILLKFQVEAHSLLAKASINRKDTFNGKRIVVVSSNIIIIARAGLVIYLFGFFLYMYSLTNDHLFLYLLLPKEI